MTKKTALMRELRDEYHRQILRRVLRFQSKKAAWNNTDTGSSESIRIANEIAKNISGNTGETAGTSPLHVQAVGAAFEEVTVSFLERAFMSISHLRPGQWSFDTGGKISDFDQYAHLAEINKVLKNHPSLRVALGDYIVAPDIVIARAPESDKTINDKKEIVDAGKDVASNTPLRARNAGLRILHASVSCKWTLRSDRAQNVRTEGLNLVRNRKGGTPRVVVVTGEPLPSRMTPLAFGTGDIDCVYHFALSELQAAVDNKSDMLNMLVESRRLRDISDLPFDLAI